MICISTVNIPADQADALATQGASTTRNLIDWGSLFDTQNTDLEGVRPGGHVAVLGLMMDAGEWSPVLVFHLMFRKISLTNNSFYAGTRPVERSPD